MLLLLFEFKNVIIHGQRLFDRIWRWKVKWKQTPGEDFLFSYHCRLNSVGTLKHFILLKHIFSISLVAREPSKYPKTKKQLLNNWIDFQEAVTFFLMPFKTFTLLTLRGSVHPLQHKCILCIPTLFFWHRHTCVHKTHFCMQSILGVYKPPPLVFWTTIEKPH